MTNAMIIGTAMQLNGITERVDTYAGWKRKGFQVQKGSKALFQTKIWKPVKNKAKAEDTAEDQDEEVQTGHMILVNASFFGLSQVQPIGAA